MPWNSAPAPGLPHAVRVRPEPDRPEGDEPVGENDQRQGEREPTWQKEERGRENGRSEKREPPDPVDPLVILDRPPGQEHQRVGDSRGRHEAVEGDREHEQCGRSGRARGEDSRPRGATLDPGEQEDQEQGREREHVALLDAVGEARCERSDHESSPAEESDGDREEHLERLVERPGPGRENDRCRNGNHADVEIELGQVIDDEVRRLRDVVMRLADDGIRSEQPAQRLAPRGLRREPEHGRRQEDGVQPAVRPDGGAKRPAPEEPEQKWRRDRCGREDDALRPGEADGTEQDEERDVAARSRTLEQRDEREDAEQQDRVVRVLRHHGGRVDHRRHGDREQRCEQRERLRDDTAGEQVRRHGRKGHHEAVDRLESRIRIGDAVEHGVGGCDQDRDRPRRSPSQRRRGRPGRARTRSSSPSPSR